MPGLAARRSPAALVLLAACAALAPPAQASRNGLLAAELVSPCVGGTSLTAVTPAHAADTDCSSAHVGIVTVRPDGREPRRLPVPRDVDSPMFSGDGRYLAFRGQGGTAVAVTDPAGRSRRWLARSDWGIDGMDWSPGGHVLVYGRVISGRHSLVSVLVRVGADGSSRRQFGRGAQPAWSPDGRRIAYSRESSVDASDIVTRVMVMRPDGTGARVLRTVGADATVEGWTRDGRSVICSGSSRRGDWWRYAIDLRTGRVRAAPSPLWLISPDGRLHATVRSGSIVVGPVGGRARRILGPPARWGGETYDHLDWQPLP